MKILFHHRWFNLIIVGALALTFQSSAQGVPTFRVSDGVNTVTIADNGLGDFSPVIGGIFFIGTVGDWSFRVTGVTKPASGSAPQPFMDILVSATSTGPGILTIQFSEDSYGPAFGPVVASIGGTLEGPDSSITFSTFASSTNTQFAGISLTPELAFIGSAPFNGDAFGSLALPANFALTEKVVITHTAGSTTGADAALSFEGQPTTGGPLTTYTMGGWGAKPAGNNPARFLADNFATVYPSGLTLGGGFTLKFTSAKSIENFLPCGGTAAALNQSFLNPPAKLGVLAGQVVALTLGVDFSNAGVTASGLAAAKFKSGKFAGKTVGEVLALAQSVLGGAALPPGCSYSDLSDACTLVNENYDEGVNGGKLVP